METYSDTLSKSPSEDVASLYSYLLSKGNELIKPRLSSAALTFEFPTWQITLYAPEDYDQLLSALKKTIKPEVPA